MMDAPSSTPSTAAVMAESNANVAYWDANRAVVEAARRLRKARADWDAGCPEPLTSRYTELNATLDTLDALEKRR